MAAQRDVDVPVAIGVAPAVTLETSQQVPIQALDKNGDWIGEIK
jgi:hypothetical protein